MEREGIKRIVRVEHAPPENELPVVLPSDITWSGAGVVFAIPALLLYTTGVELLIIYQTQQPPVVTGDDRSSGDASAATLYARDIIEKLQGLKVNGRPVTSLGGDFNDRGRYDGREWVPARVLVNGDQVFTLDWPGIANVERRIARASIVDAMPRITTLW